jgi:hypothetical protein
MVTFRRNFATRNGLRFTDETYNEIMQICHVLGTTSEVACGPTEYRCPGEFRCLPEQWVCDGDPDCKEGTDELNCSK